MKMECIQSRLWEYNTYLVTQKNVDFDFIKIKSKADFFTSQKNNAMELLYQTKY